MELLAPAATPEAEDFVVEARWMGRIPYAQALSLQEDLVGQRQRGVGADSLLLLEHPPVVTLGRGADASHLLLGPNQLKERGIDVFETGRGGDVTFHGPGQLVGYPVVLLPPAHRDLHRLLRLIEEVLIAVCRDFGVEAGRVEGLTGVWVANEKMAAIGLRVSRWVTSHGFAFNVNTDLSGFSVIVPCGIRGKGVTSLARQLGRRIPLEEVARVTARCFGQVFGARMTGRGLASSCGSGVSNG